MNTIIHIKATFCENYFIHDILLNNEVMRNEENNSKEKTKS